ncbi:MAG TPA: DUF5063 domain-containing protein [Candidatus Cybelea sp.]|nr:DUF5063 domain-containing protein [Candidatus Cybelea sp.]
MRLQDYDSDGVERFKVIAQKYCSVIDSRHALEKTEFLLQIYRILPELISKGIQLPPVQLADDEGEEKEASIREARAKRRMKHEEWSELYNSLKEKLGNWDLYWQLFDPTTDNEPIHGSLADDIADIYRDLKDGIDLSESNEVPPSEIIFDWRLGFFSHWGKHAIDALRTSHFLLEGTL